MDMACNIVPGATISHIGVDNEIVDHMLIVGCLGRPREMVHHGQSTGGKAAVSPLTLCNDIERLAPAAALHSAPIEKGLEKPRSL